MRTIDNIYRFSDLAKISIRRIEGECGFSNNYLKGIEKGEYDIPPEKLEIFVGKFSTQLSTYGFVVTDLRPFGRIDKGIVFGKPNSTTPESRVNSVEPGNPPSWELVLQKLETIEKLLSKNPRKSDSPDARKAAPRGGVKSKPVEKGT